MTSSSSPENTIPVQAPVPLGLDGGPLYQQIRAGIVGRIADGTWPSGAALPSEMRLAAEFGVSQGTVRKALDALAAENMVVRRQGKGTFVAEHTQQRALFHFFHLVGDDGSRRLPLPGRTLGVRRRDATRDDIKQLALAANAKVIEIERVRNLDERPAILERLAVPARLFPDLDRQDSAELPNELYHLYETAYGIIIHRAVENLRAVPANRRDASHLGLDVGAPLLEIQRVAFTVDGVAVERRVSRCDSRRHTYVSEII